MRLPSPDYLWERHEKLILDIFLKALLKLRDKESTQEDEPTLNEQLYIHVRSVYLGLSYKQRPLSFVKRNSEIPPRNMDEVGKPWTKKKPDFQWELINNNETDSQKAIKEYAIECKRLREKLNKGRNFINEYVVKGIIRYISREHRYGIGTKSGAMIGYIQNMEYEEALKRINSVIREVREYRIPEIAFANVNPNGLGGVRKGNHTLTRNEISPYNFDLRHIWVELMN
jgi:hypothetical protein